MDNSTLAGFAGIVLSLAFSYVPGLKEKYAALSAEYKALVMLSALLVACLFIMAASCLEFMKYVACDVTGIKALVGLFVSAIVANQATYLLTPPAK